MKLTRREMIGSALGAMAGGALSACVSVTASPKPQADQWMPQKLDPAEAARIGYENFYFNDHGCCYGAFKGIISLMGQKHGAPAWQAP